MSRTPPIPAEQRSFATTAHWDRLRSAEPGRRDERTVLESSQPDDDDDDVSPEQQGRHGNVAINTHHQDR